jgi:hypothetical protein
MPAGHVLGAKEPIRASGIQASSLHLMQRVGATGRAPSRAFEPVSGLPDASRVISGLPPLGLVQLGLPGTRTCGVATAQPGRSFGTAALFSYDARRRL